MSVDVSKVKGVVIGYRKSKAIQYNNQVLVKLFVDPTIIANMIGAKVMAKDAHGNIYRGKIVKVHSYRNSIVVVRFKPNIPGQLIGESVDILKE